MGPLNPLGKGASAVYEQLRKEILEGVITSGTVLQQIELAERLGVSRTPIRHALHQLAHDGLVEFLPGQTARVVSASFQAIFEMRQVRLWLEVPALLLALRNNPQPQELLSILNQIEALGDEPTLEACNQIVVLDEQFHRWVVRESGNKTLEVIVERLLDLQFRGKPFNVATDYKAIRENLLGLRTAILQQDWRQARHLMIEHMTDTSALNIEPIGFEDI